MSKISTYTTVTPVVGDKVIGTDIGSSDATKNFTVESIAALAGSAFTSVLSAESVATQTPGATNTQVDVEFGAAQGTASDPVMITVLGGVTFNEVGSYVVEVCLNFRSTADPAQAAWEMAINSTGIETYVTYLSAPNHYLCDSRTVVRKVTTAGEVLQVVFSSDTGGGLAGMAQLESLNPNTAGFGNVPSASLKIYRLDY